jgi:hypothetical protein
MRRGHMRRDADRIDSPRSEFGAETGRRSGLRDRIADDEVDARLAVGEMKHLDPRPGFANRAAIEFD